MFLKKSGHLFQGRILHEDLVIGKEKEAQSEDLLSFGKETWS